jgi:hypothetical protein
MHPMNRDRPERSHRDASVIVAAPKPAPEIPSPPEELPPAAPVEVPPLSPEAPPEPAPEIPAPPPEVPPPAEPEFS